MVQPPAPAHGSDSLFSRLLTAVERVGNRLPDPALLFVFVLLATWALSYFLSGRVFTTIDPTTKELVTLLDPRTQQPLVVQNLLEAPSLVAFLAGMVTTFTSFPPLGVVLVSLLGVGVAEHTGLMHASLKSMLGFTPARLLAPMVILVGILSHSTADAGFVLVIPLGGVIYQAAGRHPLAGIAAAFAGVSGGFSANPVPSSLDPLLQGFTQSAAQLLDPARVVNPLCNWAFTGSSSVLVVLLGWFITDRIIEPRLRTLEVDGDRDQMPTMETLGAPQKRGLLAAALSMAAALALLALAAAPSSSPLRDANGELGTSAAPLMRIIVPLIFLLFLIPGVVYGVVSGTVKSHHDVVKGMAKSMSSMGYYMVLAFFCSLFLDAFNKSNLGALMALEGAAFLRELGLPAQLTIVGVILLSGAVNIVIGSASAKWALLSPIFVPMLMQLGISPELTQAAYRVGDSTTNIITPLMYYFPLVVVYCTRYVKHTGIGTLISLMLPYSVTFLVAWTLYLLAFWGLGIPLGPGGGYTYP